MGTEACREAGMPRLAAVMPLPRSSYAEVLLRESMYRSMAEHEYTQAVEAALATVLGREVRVSFKYAP